LVPAGVGKACLRSDAAGYQEKLLKYCAEAGISAQNIPILYILSRNGNFEAKD